MPIEYRLCLELMFVGALILTILFVNSIFLYKQKLTDHITQMTIAGVFVCVFEILWALFDGNPDLRAFTYIVSCGYNIAFLVFAMILNAYCLSRFDLHPSKLVLALIYGIPSVVATLLCVTTPWTGLVYLVDEAGVLHEGMLFSDLFPIVLYIYFFLPIIIGAYFLTIGKKRRPAAAVIPGSLFLFGLAAPFLYWLEALLLGEEYGMYQILTLPIALAMMYLITNESTRTALESRANMEAVEADLRIASHIQEDALPPASPEFADHPNVELRCSMNTAKEVGGDFYDYFPIDEHRICFLIADVSGKGTPAALFMMTAKTMIKDFALNCESTSEIFSSVNARLCESNDESMFATAWIGILDMRTMTLQFTNAGHTYPIFQRKGQPCREIEEVHGLILAVFDSSRYKQSEIQLQPGDRLFFYTDGVTEAHDVNDALYGTERLERTLESVRGASGQEVLDSVLEDVRAYAQGTPQFDDITMLVLTIRDDA